MQHSIISILSSWPVLVVAALTTIVTAFVFWLRADNFRFTLFAYKRPWAFGSDHRGQFQLLSKESNDSPVDANNLVHAEQTLCKTFKAAISGSPNAEVTKGQFERAQSYLKITQQTTIRPPSIVANIGLFVLILAESVGTGYVLAPWMSTEITPSQANLAAGVLALAVAIILALLTHHTGTEMAKFAHYRKHSGTEGAGDRIGLGDDQDQDAYYIDSGTQAVRPNPQARRYFNRIEDPGIKGPAQFGAALVMIVGIMLLIFLIRVGGVESETTKQIVSMETNGVSTSGDSNPFASAGTSTLPPSVAEAQQQSRTTVAESLGGNYKMQGLAASFMLALIYLVTQFTAFIIAFKSGFSGQGAAAFAFTRDQASFDTFRRKFLEPRITKVESMLEQLRRAREKRHHRIGKGSFEAFLAAGEQREEEARDGLIDTAASNISHGRTEQDRDLQWELAVKNYGFTSSEQVALAQKVRENTLVRETMRMPVASLKPTADSLDRGEADKPVRTPAKPDFGALAQQFVELKDDVARSEFLETQSEKLSDDDFNALREEIKRRKKLAKSAEKYGDLLGD